MAASRCSWLQLLAALCLSSTVSNALKNCDFSSKVNVTLQQIVLTCQCPSSPSVPYVHLVSIPDRPSTDTATLMQLTPVPSSQPPPQSPWVDQKTFNYTLRMDSLALSDKQPFVCVTEGMDLNHHTVDDRYHLTVSLLDLYPMPSATTETTPTITTTTTSMTPTSESTTVQQPTTAEAGNSSPDGTVTTSSAVASTALASGAAVKSIPFNDQPRNPGQVLADSQDGESFFEKEVLGIPVKMLILVGVSFLLSILVVALIFFVVGNRRRARRNKRLPAFCGRQGNSNDVQLDVIHRLLTHLTSSDHIGHGTTCSSHRGHGIPSSSDSKTVSNHMGHRLSGSSSDTGYDCADDHGSISPTGSTYAICDGPTKAPRMTLGDRAAAATLCEMGGHQIHFANDAVHQMSHFGDSGGHRIHFESELHQVSHFGDSVGHQNHVKNEPHQVSHLDELIRHQFRGNHPENEVQEDSHYDEVEPEEAHYDDLKDDKLYDDIKEARIYDELK